MSDKKENVHQNHRQRMRERFCETGFAGFSQHQVLEMLLFYTYPRIDTNELAHNLINTFGSISALFDADVEDIVKKGKVTMNTAVLFKMITKCQEMYYTYQMDYEPYDNIEKLKNLFLAVYAGVPNEEFRIACFDNELRLIGRKTHCICAGHSSMTFVEIRKIYEIAISTNCSFVVLSHNHPNGRPEPGKTDIRTTRMIIDHLKMIGVKTLDHIIVGAHSAYSFRDNAMINVFE